MKRQLIKTWLNSCIVYSICYSINVWFIKIWTTHNLSLWLYEYFWIILKNGYQVYFISKVLAWEIGIMKWGFATKVMIKSQRQFMYGSNFYESDVTSLFSFYLESLASLTLLILVYVLLSVKDLKWGHDITASKVTIMEV